MPNHVLNEVTAAPHVLAALIRAITPEERAEHYAAEEASSRRIEERTGEKWPMREPIEEFVDFELLVPPPANIEQGGCNGQHAEGVVCWYEWQIEHWGTKWNAYDFTRQSENQITFSTAWSHPAPVMQALLEKFPGERIEIRYADEDFGFNLGHYLRDEQGLFMGAAIHEATPAAYELASDLLYDMTFAEYQEMREAEDRDYRRERRDRAMRSCSDYRPSDDGTQFSPCSSCGHHRLSHEDAGRLSEHQLTDVGTCSCADFHAEGDHAEDQHTLHVLGA